MIYCVEDDAGIRELEVYTLNQSGLAARGLTDGTQLSEALLGDAELPKLILLDIMLPGKDGVAILQDLRADARTRGIPVIMATAKGTEFDKVVGLNKGADDYLVKPFGMMEMVARVKAVLRRTAGLAESPVLTCGSISMDIGRHLVTAGENKIDLTLKEYEVLHLLLSNPGMVFSRDRLLSAIWGYDYTGETRTVDVHIRTLRQKLGGYGDCISTVRGVGYRLEAGK